MNLVKILLLVSWCESLFHVIDVILARVHSSDACTSLFEIVMLQCFFGSDSFLRVQRQQLAEEIES